MEGDALGLPAGIMGLVQGGSSITPPVDQLQQVIHHANEHIDVGIWYSPGGHGGGSVTTKGSEIKLLEAISYGGAGETQALGNGSGGEAFSG
jgi:hypothetical protein